MIFFSLLITVIVYKLMPTQLYLWIGLSGALTTLYVDFTNKAFMETIKVVCKSKFEYYCSLFLTSIFRFLIMLAWPSAFFTLLMNAFPAKTSV